MFAFLAYSLSAFGNLNALTGEQYPAVFVVSSIVTQGTSKEGITCYPGVNTNDLPLPVIIVAENASIQTWAHEFGHLRGLGHVKDLVGREDEIFRNFMWEGSVLNDPDHAMTEMDCYQCACMNSEPIPSHVAQSATSCDSNDSDAGFVPINNGGGGGGFCSTFEGGAMDDSGSGGLILIVLVAVRSTKRARFIGQCIASQTTQEVSQ